MARNSTTALLDCADAGVPMPEVTAATVLVRYSDDGYAHRPNCPHVATALGVPATGAELLAQARRQADKVCTDPRRTPGRMPLTAPACHVANLLPAPLRQDLTLLARTARREIELTDVCAGNVVSAARVWLREHLDALFAPAVLAQPAAAAWQSRTRDRMRRQLIDALPGRAPAGTVVLAAMTAAVLDAAAAHRGGTRPADRPVLAAAAARLAGAAVEPRSLLPKGAPEHAVDAMRPLADVLTAVPVPALPVGGPAERWVCVHISENFDVASTDVLGLARSCLLAAADVTAAVPPPGRWGDRHVFARVPSAVVDAVTGLVGRRSAGALLHDLGPAGDGELGHTAARLLSADGPLADPAVALDAARGVHHPPV